MRLEEPQVRPKPIELNPEYLRAIERAEALDCNRPGSDKSWVWKTLREARLHLARARRR